jgi:lysozyme
MKISKLGIELIKHYEGFRSRAYKCPAGVVTIGYGTTYYPSGQRVKITDEITEQKAEELLLQNLVSYEKEVDVMTTDDITQSQFDALVSFAYNLGSNALKGSTLLKKVNKNTKDQTIPSEFSKWVKAGGKTLQGLVTRRISEAKLYSTGKLDFL